VREGLTHEKVAEMLLPGGRLWNGAQLRVASAVENHGALIDLLRRSSQFDASGFEEALNTTEGTGTLDSAINWLTQNLHRQLTRMSYLQPLSALPVIHYIASKSEEVDKLLLIIRGLSAGLDRTLIEEHLMF
jgi:vacuolar-type H+-ATPase subunit C/Vma6